MTINTNNQQYRHLGESVFFECITFDEILTNTETMKLLNTTELCQANTIGVKVIDEKREYKQDIGTSKVKTIKRTKYLKICWMCGEPYESKKYNTYACSKRCVQNSLYIRKKGFNPPANMVELSKAKNVKEIKERFGYR